MAEAETKAKKRLSDLPAFRALGYRDFRLLWVGAFLSFTGSMVQNVAQGYMVFEITGDRAKLAMVSFAMMLPISILGPVLGIVSDMYDKRKILVICMVVSAVGPCFLGWAAAAKVLEYWHFLVVAAISGLVTCIEVPTRQSVVRSVVDEKDLAAAIPAQASTFNLARVVGPALGGFLAAQFGAPVCFVANGVSFFCLAIAAWAIRTDLRPIGRRVEPIRDLVLEGIRYTFRDKSLRVLFLLESATAVFATFYVAIMAAIAKEQLHLDVFGLSVATSCVGIGAFVGIVVLASLSQKEIKRQMVLVSMSTMAVAIFLLGFIHTPVVAYALMTVMGACTIMQFNTTNTLFQLVAPPRLRGRVISMHMWAISGIAPLGVLVFGYLSQWAGISVSLWSGGAILAVCAVLGWMNRKNIVEPTMSAGAA